SRTLLLLIAILLPAHSLIAGDTGSTDTYKRIKAAINAVPAIDTHDHMWRFDRLPAYTQTKAGKQVNLAGLWRNSYLAGYNSMTPWRDDDDFRSGGGGARKRCY